VHGDVAEPMWCNARQSAEAFYQRHGWQGVSEPFVIEPIGPHRRMRHDP
jgi:predicted GNAT family N-acyltransferase